MYDLLQRELAALVEGETNFITNASNLSALIYEQVESLNWVGFYMMSNSELLLGPFQGKTACLRIKLGSGVCGTSAKELNSIIVPDVHKFSGHIACDSASNSEIVIPLIKDGKIYGVLDIDSPKFDRFNDDDKIGFEQLVEILVNSSDMEGIYKYYNRVGLDMTSSTT